MSDIHITTISPDGSIASITQPAVPEYDQLRELVGGMIEAVPLFGRYQGRWCVAFCDEEGKLFGLEPNQLATQEWANAIHFAETGEHVTTASLDSLNGDFLVGPVVIVAADELSDLADL